MGIIENMCISDLNKNRRLLDEIDEFLSTQTNVSNDELVPTLKEHIVKCHKQLREMYNMMEKILNAKKR